MARINQDLIKALIKRLGVGQARVYALIQKMSATNRVPRHLGALLLAGDSGISLQKYASAEDLRELRGLPAHHPVDMTVPATQSRPAPANGKSKPTKPVKAKDNSIFVVHGRDTKLTESMYAFLRAIGINPMEWNDAIKAAKGNANPIVGDVIDNAMAKVQGVMVLFSPDEEAKLKTQFVGDKDKKSGLHKLDGQPRPNVIFEAGMALGKHSDKTILVQVGDIRDISDIAGKHMVHLTDSAASRKALAYRLQDKLKFKINLVGDAWLNAGDFKR